MLCILSSAKLSRCLEDIGNVLFSVSTSALPAVTMQFQKFPPFLGAEYSSTLLYPVSANHIFGNDNLSCWEVFKRHLASWK
jgi:hypothetical protein